MDVCMCACVHVCMCACVHVCCMHVCMCACVLYACMHVCRYACTYLCTCVRVYVRTCVRAYVRMYVSSCFQLFPVAISSVLPLRVREWWSRVPHPEVGSRLHLCRTCQDMSERVKDPLQPWVATHWSDTDDTLSFWFILINMNFHVNFKEESSEPLNSALAMGYCTLGRSGAQTKQAASIHIPETCIWAANHDGTPLSCMLCIALPCFAFLDSPWFTYLIFCSSCDSWSLAQFLRFQTMFLTVAGTNLGVPEVIVSDSLSIHGSLSISFTFQHRHRWRDRVECSILKNLRNHVRFNCPAQAFHCTLCSSYA